MLIESTYQSPFPLNNGHVETLVPYFLRKLPPPSYFRERIETDDHDFLDLDWCQRNHKKLAVLSHGLEGCSHSNYIVGLGHKLSEYGYDVLAWNNRGCSGETNRLQSMYHSGASFDLRTVLNHVLEKHEYNEVYLVGFSMGGNITLKYLGEEGDQVDSRIKKAVAVSTPLSLGDCAEALSSGISLGYSRHFILRIIKKLKQKQAILPDFNPDIKGLKKIWDFESFDNKFTAPMHGFKDARDYWDKASSLPLLTKIKVKALIINALNDPFLGDQCYPYEMLKTNEFVDLETPNRGGHVGFLSDSLKTVWTESRILEYLQEIH